MPMPFFRGNHMSTIAAPDAETGTLPVIKRNIFDIDAELDSIAMAFDQLADTGEDQAVLEAIESYFGDLLNERDRKIDGYCRLIDDYIGRAEAQKKEADRIAALAKTNKANADRLKTRLKVYFDANEITKIDTPLHKLWVQKNGGATPIIIAEEFIQDPSKLPVEFQVVTITPNTDAIRAELKKEDAERLCDMTAIAALGEVGSHMRIK